MMDTKIILKNLSIEYEKILLCIDYIIKEDYNHVKKIMDGIINKTIYTILNDIDTDEYLYTFLKSVKNNLVTLRDKLTNEIDLSLYTNEQIISFQYKLKVFVLYFYNKIHEYIITEPIRQNDNGISNKDNLLDNVKVDLYTLCWNEIDLLPFVVDYWKRFVNHAYVFDNGSNDGSIEFLSQFDWITVLHFETNGKFNTDSNMNIKNNAWKYSRYNADFVVVCDLDECLFATDMKKELQYMIDHKQNILRPRWFTMKGEHMYDHDSDLLLHQQMKTAHGDGEMNKVIMFNPNSIKEINFEPGCHICHPKSSELNVYDGKNIFMLHFEKCFGVDYAVARKKLFNSRRSEMNIKNGYGVHYAYSEDKIRDDYNNDLKKSFDINNIINNK